MKTSSRPRRRRSFPTTQKTWSETGFLQLVHTYSLSSFRSLAYHITATATATIIAALANQQLQIHPSTYPPTYLITHSPTTPPTSHTSLTDPPAASSAIDQVNSKDYTSSIKFAIFPTHTHKHTH